MDVRRWTVRLSIAHKILSVKPMGSDDDSICQGALASSPEFNELTRGMRRKCAREWLLQYVQVFV